jgi:hypothetical protein
MNRFLVSVVLAVFLLGISWAQAPQTSASLVWDTPVAHADFAWDRMNRPLDGVGDSPLVP